MNATSDQSLNSPGLIAAIAAGPPRRVRAKLPSGAELLFCQHHANEHEAKLVELGRHFLEAERGRVVAPVGSREIGQIGQDRRLVSNAAPVMNDQSPPMKPSRHHIPHIMRRTLSKSWDDSIFAESAQAAFWCALSLPAAAAGDAGQPGLRRAAFRSGHPAGDSGSVDQHGRPLLLPQCRERDHRADRPRHRQGRPWRGGVGSGFVISLWAGSSAISAFVDSITEAHDQTPLRHPVRQRFSRSRAVRGSCWCSRSLGTPFVAPGPRKIAEWLPDSWDNVSGVRRLPGVVPSFLVVIVYILNRVSLRPSRCRRTGLLLGSVLATVVFLCRHVRAAGSISRGSPPPATRTARSQRRSRSCRSPSSSASRSWWGPS